MGALALQNFGFNDHLVRVSDRNGNAWFVGNDVCAALELKNPRQVISRLETDERDDVHIVDAIGRNQKTTIISESGLYALIFTSRKAVAVQFRKWVTGEVLPSIRKTGQFGESQTLAALSKRIEEMQAAIRLLTLSHDRGFARSLAYHPQVQPLTKLDGRRRNYTHPRFWPDVEVRERVIALYGQATNEGAAKILAEEFGPRAPKKSSINRFWMKLHPVMRSPQ